MLNTVETLAIMAIVCLVAYIVLKFKDPLKEGSPQ